MTKIGNWLAIGLALLAGAGFRDAEAASNYYLRLDGVPGVIEISSFSVGAGVPAHTEVGAGGVATRSHGPSSIHFAARTSPAIVKLSEANARGTHFPTATLEAFKGGGASPYLRYKMTDVVVSSFQTGGSGGGGGETFDQFVLNFSKVDLEYLQASPPAGPGDPSSKWSKKAGEAPLAAPPPSPPPAGSGAASAVSVQPGGVVAALPGTITAVKVQPAAVDSGGTVTMTVEGTGECKYAWLDFGDKSQAQAQPFGSPFPKAFSHVFASPGTFTVIAWGYDPDSPQKAAPKAGTCIGKKTATVQVRSLMMVAPAIKK